MTFSSEQVSALTADLYRANVKERKQAGRQLSYIEGWLAESEANRIFGHHAWDSETTDLRVVAEKARKIGSDGVDGWGVSYIAKVRVTVTTPDGHEVIRDGVGAGHGIDRDLGLAHESAAKEATTDAEKRALKTFGNPFGLALYDKTQAHVSDGRAAPSNDVPSSHQPSGRKTPAQAKRDGDHEKYTGEIDKLDAAGVLDWTARFDEYTADAPVQWLTPLRDRLQLRHEELNGAASVADEEAALDAGFRGAVGERHPGRVAGGEGAVA